MKRSPLRRKSLAKTSLKKALRLAEDAWKKAVVRRDRGLCQVHLESCPDPDKQADHFRSRKHGWTFLDIRNGTLVCKGLNMSKAMGWHNAAEKIAFVVLKREGQETVDYLLQMSRKTKKWNLTELEDLTAELNSMYLEER